MAVTGVRARNFIRGGASSVFARKRGMTAARPVRAAAPSGETSKFGKASGRDYANFFSSDKNVKALRSAVVNLKNMLVEGFKAVKSLQASVGNIAGQLSGKGKPGGGLNIRAGKGGGLFGIFAAIAIALGVFFSPQLKEAFGWMWGKATNIFGGLWERVKGIFKTIQTALRKVDEQVIQKGYKNIQNFVEMIRGWIRGANAAITSINTTIDGIYQKFGLIIPGDKPKPIPPLPNIPDDLLPDYDGLHFLKEDYGWKELKLDAGNVMGSASEAAQGMFGGISDMFQNMFGSMFGSPAKTQTQTQSATTTSSGASGGSQSQMEVAQTLINEFKNQGLSGEGAKLATAEIGRENSLNINTILGTHDDRGTTAYGAISWQGGREQVLFDELRARGIEPTVEGLRNSGDEGIRANAAAMIKEMSNPNTTEYRPELLSLLKKQTLSDAEKDKVRQLMKDRYFRYDPTIPIQRSREWYDRINSFGLQSALPIQKVPQRQGNINLLTVPGPQVAQAPPRPRQLISTNTPDGLSGSPAVSFYSPSNSDSFEHISSKAAYSLVG